jgi:hypothetical protein
LKLLDDELLANLGGIQLRSGLRPSDSLASCGRVRDVVDYVDFSFCGKET